jgi:hypothetical protein
MLSGMKTPRDRKVVGNFLKGSGFVAGNSLPAGGDFPTPSGASPL